MQLFWNTNLGITPLAVDGGFHATISKWLSRYLKLESFAPKKISQAGEESGETNRFVFKVSRKRIQKRIIKGKNDSPPQSPIGCNQMK